MRMTKILLRGTVIVAMALSVAGQGASDCPAGANGSVQLMIVNETGLPVPSAAVVFTANNWDSTLNLPSDQSGGVRILCVPAGPGYDVTVVKSPFATVHLNVAAEPRPRTVRVTMPLIAGRSVRVFHLGNVIPGVTVTIRDSDGTIQTTTTDQKGIALFKQLAAKGKATFEVALAGFYEARAEIDSDVKNGAVVFDLAIKPVCGPLIV